MDAIVGTRALYWAEAVQGSPGWVTGDRDESARRQAQAVGGRGDRRASDASAAGWLQRLRADGFGEGARACPGGAFAVGARLLDDPGEDDEVRAGSAAIALRSAVPAGASDGRPGTYEFHIDGEA